MGLTQKATAQQLGVSAPFINKVEKGETLPSYDRLKDFCALFALPFEELWKTLEDERAKALRRRIDARSALLPKGNFSAPTQDSTSPKRAQIDSPSQKERFPSPSAQRSFSGQLAGQNLTVVGDAFLPPSTELKEVRASCETLIAALAAKPEMAPFVRDAVDGIANLVLSDQHT